MAERKQSGLMGISEDLIGRITELPGANKLMDGLNTLRERVDDLQKRMRGLDELEKRVNALERRVDKLAGGSSSGATESGIQKSNRVGKTSVPPNLGGATPMTTYGNPFIWMA